jgi:hypothetical protein
MVGVVSRVRAGYLRIVFMMEVTILVRFLGIELKALLLFLSNNVKKWTERLTALLLLPGRLLPGRLLVKTTIRIALLLRSWLIGPTRRLMRNELDNRFKRSRLERGRNKRLVRSRLALLRRKLLRKLVGSRRNKVGERLLRWRLETRPVLKRSARRLLALLVFNVRLRRRNALVKLRRLLEKPRSKTLLCRRALVRIHLIVLSRLVIRTAEVLRVFIRVLGPRSVRLWARLMRKVLRRPLVF